MAEQKKSKARPIAQNKRARFEYEILETFEAGLVLSGTEVRSLRDRNCQLTDCFALVRKGEVWLHNVHIAPFSHGNINNLDPDRKRKLLLHKNQIRYLEQKTAEQGFAVVPLRMYFNEDGRVKVEIALAKGKKIYDKRDTMAKRDSQREVERALKERSRY